MVLEDETIVVAEQQTNGRGQMGAGWYSKSGESLTFSIFKRFSGLTIMGQFQVNFTVALCLKEALEELGMEQVFIKWPNDILAVSKKLGGILIENRLQQDQVVSSIIGIGLNVNNAVLDHLPQATSMLLSVEKEYNLHEVMQLIASKICKRLEALSGEFSQDLQRQFEDALFRKDVISVFEDANQTRFNAIIRGVSSIGELLLELEDEKIQKFQLKELKLLY